MSTARTVARLQALDCPAKELFEAASGGLVTAQRNPNLPTDTLLSLIGNGAYAVLDNPALALLLLDNPARVHLALAAGVRARLDALLGHTKPSLTAAKKPLVAAFVVRLVRQRLPRSPSWKEELSRGFCKAAVTSALAGWTDEEALAHRLALLEELSGLEELGTQGRRLRHYLARARALLRGEP